MTTAARLERGRLADLLDELGPDEPTLCGSWTTGDLAAHIVIRERRPDAAAGIVIGKLAGHTAAVQRTLRERTPYGDLVSMVRAGPPMWSPLRLDRVDRLVNTAEFFVHHEDVRRAQPDWSPRTLDDDLADDLDAALRRGAKLMARKAPAGVTLEPDAGRARIVARDAEPMVVIRGPIGELTMWLFGRQAHAHVSYDGRDDAIEALRTAEFDL